jgi:hypothetical protein
MSSLHDIDILEQLFARGLIPAHEYSIRRVQLINRLTNTVYSPASGADVVNTAAPRSIAAETPPAETAASPLRAPNASSAMDTTSKSSAMDIKLDSMLVSSTVQLGSTGAVAVNPTSQSAALFAQAEIGGNVPPRPVHTSNIALPPIEFITNMPPMDVRKEQHRLVASAPGPVSIFGPSGPFVPPAGAIPLQLPPTPTNMNVTTFHQPLPHTSHHSAAVRAANFPFGGRGPLNDQRFSESSSFSSEEESSESDARKSRSKRRLHEISVPLNVSSDKLAQDPVSEDANIPSSASKRLKTSESEDIALASLAAIASSSSESSQHKQTVINKLRSELSDSHAAIQDAHAALHEYVLRDEERRRLNIASQYPPFGAFPSHTSVTPMWGPQQFMGPILTPAAMNMDPAMASRFAQAPGFPHSHAVQQPTQRPAPVAPVPVFRLDITAQPPSKVVYQRILKPFPQVTVSFISSDSGSDGTPAPSLWNNLYVEATLLRNDSREQISHVDGSTMVRVWNGVATFRKLKIMSTTQQIGSGLVISFILKHFEGNEFKTLPCSTVVSSAIEVFSHSQYLKGSNAKDKEKEIRQTLQNNVSEEQSAAEAQHHKDRLSSDESATASGSSSTRQGSPSDSPPNERELEVCSNRSPKSNTSTVHHLASVVASTGCASEVTAKEMGDVKTEPLPEISVAAGDS